MVFKMIFGAILGVCLFFVGKDALEESESWITWFASLVVMGCGILAEIAIVLMLFNVI